MTTEPQGQESPARGAVSGESTMDAGMASIVEGIFAEAPAQPTATETVPVTQEASVTPVAAEEPSEDLSASMAHILKREAALAKRKQEITAVEETAKKFASYKERASKGDYQAALDLLEEVGLTYDKLTGYLLEDKDPVKQELDSVKSEIQKIREEAQQAAAAAKAAEEAEAVENYKNSLVNVANNLGDELEFCRLAGQEAIDLAFEITQLHWEQKAEILPREEALRLVEAHLEKEHEQSVLKYKQLKKLSKHFTPPVQTAPQRIEPARQIRVPQPASLLAPEPRLEQVQARTLAGQNGASSGNAAQPQSEAELREAAIAMLRGGR